MHDVVPGALCLVHHVSVYLPLLCFLPVLGAYGLLASVIGPLAHGSKRLQRRGPLRVGQEAP